MTIKSIIVVTVMLFDAVSVIKLDKLVIASVHPKQLQLDSILKPYFRLKFTKNFLNFHLFFSRFSIMLFSHMCIFPYHSLKLVTDDVTN